MSIEFRELARRMELAMEQLVREGLEGRVLVERMVGYVPDLARIWRGASDAELGRLCQEYPGFQQYAVLMEEMAVLERSQHARSYADLPELPDTFKEVLSRLLGSAATLEGCYRTVLEADCIAECQHELHDLNQLHVIWLADVEHFIRAVKRTAIPKKAVDILVAAFSTIDARIAQMNHRAMTGN